MRNIKKRKNESWTRQGIASFSANCKTTSQSPVNLFFKTIQAALQKRLRATESERDDLKERLAENKLWLRYETRADIKKITMFMYSCSVANYERERVKLANDCETKIEQLEKKVKNDVDHEKEEKEKALAKVWHATLSLFSKQRDWLAPNTDDITSQSHSCFACSREKSERPAL